ncbi:MAG: hypothetical protein ABJC61_05420 [Acidobacteriota bacterium]
MPEAPSPAPTSRLTLRNGTVYLLREPPRVSGSRVVFTTMDGQLYSMDQSEIESIGAPRPTRTPRPYYSTEDSRALGALARRDREARGLRAEVSPRRAPAARNRAPSKKRTRKPARVTTPRA